MIKGLNSNSDWKKDFDDTTLERGKDIYYRENIMFYRVNNNEISGTVIGKDRISEYNVIIAFTDSSRTKVKSYECKCCGVNSDKLCEHEAAVLFTYEKANKQINESYPVTPYFIEEIPDEIDVGRYFDIIDQTIKKYGDFIGEIKPFFADMMGILKYIIEPMSEKHPMDAFEISRYLYVEVDDAQMCETHGRFELFSERLDALWDKLEQMVQGEDREYIADERPYIDNF